MEKINGASAGVGYVRAVFSKKLGGYAVSLQMLKVVLGVANEMSARAHNERMWARLEQMAEDGESPEDLIQQDWRERVAGAFDGYLVSDWEPFSDRREGHQYGFNAYAATCSRWPLGLGGGLNHRLMMMAGGPIDVPEEMAAGSMVSIRGEAYCGQVSRCEAAQMKPGLVNLGSACRYVLRGDAAELMGEVAK